MDSLRLGLAGLVVGLALALAPAANATTVTVDCTGLNGALGDAMVDVINLDGMCMNQSFALPSRSITLQAATPDAGFDGSGSTANAILHGTDVGSTTIRGLTFQNASLTSTDGAAISITGGAGDASPQILDNVFEDNATGGHGGAVAIVGQGSSGPVTVSGNKFGGTSVGHGNSAGIAGGALYLHLLSVGATVSDNQFIDNEVNGSGDGGGGGAAIDATGTSGQVTISGNTFDPNTVSHSSGQDDGGNLLLFPAHNATTTISDNVFAEGTVTGASSSRHGGGLAIINHGTAVSATVNQSGNVFDENSIDSLGAGEPGGGGEWVIAAVVNSVNDQFISNHLEDSDGEGGGIGVEGQFFGGTTNISGKLHAINLVANGNSVGADGIGGGIYAGSEDTCNGPDCFSVVDLSDSTVAGNCVDADTDSSGPGIAGSGNDVISLKNTIVYDAQATLLGCASPISSAELSGFTTPNTTVTFSDVCAGAGGSGAPLTGAGNICADPLLVNPHLGGFHETASSPTINVGSNALVPVGITTDLDGEARIAQGTVDLGADEVQPAPSSPPPPLGGGGAGGGGTVTDSTKPVFRFLQRVLTVDRHGRVKIKLRCVEQSRCIGTLSLVTQKAFVAKRKARKLKVGSKRFNIAGGKTGVVTIKLSPKARKLLKRTRSLKVVATVTGKDSAGNKGKATRRTLTLKRAKKKHRR